MTGMTQLTSSPGKVMVVTRGEQEPQYNARGRNITYGRSPVCICDLRSGDAFRGGS